MKSEKLDLNKSIDEIEKMIEDLEEIQHTVTLTGSNH